MIGKIILATGVCLIATGLWSPATAECAAPTWKDCAGKPWVVGEHDTPIGEKWWPNALWGAGDEAGSTNWNAQPDVVLRALAEADKGKVYKLGHLYNSSMPMFGERSYKLETLDPTQGVPLGGNAVRYFEEMVTSEIGQVGTQFDGFGHIAVSTDGTGDPEKVRFYNGFTQSDIMTDSGHKKLGVDKLHPIVARGVLIDVAASKGVEMLELGYIITLADVKAALAHQGMKDFEFLPGDASFSIPGGASCGIRMSRNSSPASPASASRSPTGWPTMSASASSAPTIGPPRRSPSVIRLAAFAWSIAISSSATASSIRRA